MTMFNWVRIFNSLEKHTCRVSHSVWGSKWYRPLPIKSRWAGKPMPLTPQLIFGRTSDAFSASVPPLAPAPQPALVLSRPALLLLALRALVLLALIRPFSVSLFFL